MGTTRFPFGVEIGDGTTAGTLTIGGTAIQPTGYVSASNVKIAAGTSILSNAGTVDVATGLTSVLWAVASPYGALNSVAGTVGGFVSCSTQTKSGGTLLIRGNDQMGTASSASGTASWIAVGT